MSGESDVDLKHIHVAVLFSVNRAGYALRLNILQLVIGTALGLVAAQLD